MTLAFTRNVIGSMDYTPVTFSAAGRVTSAAAQLAQSIVYESGLQHYADSPRSYGTRAAALELLREVPAAWDDTRLLAGAPARSVTLARRAGERWFVGSLSATGGAHGDRRPRLPARGPHVHGAHLRRRGPGRDRGDSEQRVDARHAADGRARAPWSASRSRSCPLDPIATVAPPCDRVHG